MREQMRVISSHLGEQDDGEQDELGEYFRKINALKSRMKTLKTYERSRASTKMPPTSQESYVIRNYGYLS